MDHLTDSMFEAVDVCQGGNGRWESIPLNNSKRIKEELIVTTA